MKKLLKLSCNYYSRCIVLVLTPLLLLPLPVISQTTAANCAYVVLVMAVYWVTNALHLAVVSLFPIAFFPLLGIMDTNAICTTYMKDTNVVYLASIIVGIAMEHSGFHRRIALLMLLKMGTSPRMLLLGVMMATMTISMWIMNTVAAAMMIPIVDAVFQNLEKLERESEVGIPLKSLGDSKSNDMHMDLFVGDDQKLNITEKYKKQSDSKYQYGNARKRLSCSSSFENTLMFAPLRILKYKKCILLSVAYGANIGGTGTMTATSPNIVFSQVISMLYGPNTGMSYASWLLFGIPTMLLCTLFTCAMLQLVFMGFRSSTKSSKKQAEATKDTLEREYQNLGPISFHEIGVMTSFTLLVLLYFFRRPHFMRGWEAELNPKKQISDAVPAVFLVILMCMFPANPIEALRSKDRKAAPALLDWSAIQEKIPWDLILLQGSGYALAAGFKESGLNTWLGFKFMALETFSPALLCYMAAMLCSFATEVISNASTSAILLPIVAKMAERLRVNPIYFMMPVTMSSSYSFMLPIATGPNAMVFKSGQMNTKDMLYVGFLTNCVCVSILFLMINTLGVGVYNLNTFPVWAMTDSYNLTSVIGFNNSTHS